MVLNLLEGIGPIRTRQLLEFFGVATKVLEAPLAALRRVKGIGDDLASTIRQWETTTDLAGELKRVEGFGARLIFQEDDEYPELLREIYDPPIVLYVKGRLLPEDRNSISMVGARRTTHYGQDTARKLAYKLAGAGITVVSGIDSASHQGALSAKGRTLAVLGTGINIVYPAENAELYERISKNGAVLSQFPFNRKGDTNPQPHRRRDDAWHRGGGGRPEKRLADHRQYGSGQQPAGVRRARSGGLAAEPRLPQFDPARAQSSAKMRMTFSRSSKIWRLAKRTTHPTCPWLTSPRRSKRSSTYWTEPSSQSIRSLTGPASRCRASLWRCWDWK